MTLSNSRKQRSIYQVNVKNGEAVQIVDWFYGPNLMVHGDNHTERMDTLKYIMHGVLGSMENYGMGKVILISSKVKNSELCIFGDYNEFDTHNLEGGIVALSNMIESRLSSTSYGKPEPVVVVVEDLDAIMQMSGGYKEMFEKCLTRGRKALVHFVCESKIPEIRFTGAHLRNNSVAIVHKLPKREGKKFLGNAADTTKLVEREAYVKHPEGELVKIEIPKLG